MGLLNNSLTLRIDSRNTMTLLRMQMYTSEIKKNRKPLIVAMTISVPVSTF